MQEHQQSECRRCNEYNHQPKQCVENKCWYYFPHKKCGVNYMIYDNKIKANKQINIIQKRSNKRKLSKILLKKLSRKLSKKSLRKLSKKSLKRSLKKLSKKK